LGEIPLGWEIVTMQSIINVRDGTHDSPKQSVAGFPLITSKHLKKEGLDFSNTYLISETDFNLINKRSKVHRYDILLSMIGTVGLIYLVLDEEINFAIKNVGLFKTSQKQDLLEYIYLLLNSDYGKYYFKTRLAGTTQSYLTLESLRSIPVIYPEKEILKQFKDFSSKIFFKLHNNNKQIKTLTRIRDALLPKLMSGKIRVKE